MDKNTKNRVLRRNNGEYKDTFSQTFKEETDSFFDIAKTFFQEKYGLSFTPEDVECESCEGFFIFPYGSNSIIQFHLKEAPGWLFGIWWGVEENTKEDGSKSINNEGIDCDFFAQYEELIDKFTPSNSTFVKSFFWPFRKDKDSCWCKGYKIAQTILLILQYPYVAFYRELYGADLNSQYISPKEAEDCYKDWHLKQVAQQAVLQENDKTMLKCINNLFEDVLNKGDALILDLGDYFSPRYKVVIRNSEKQGWVSVADYLGYDARKKWIDIEKWCEERAEKIGAMWLSPVADFIYFANDADFLEEKERILKEQGKK